MYSRVIGVVYFKSARFVCGIQALRFSWYVSDLQKLIPPPFFFCRYCTLLTFLFICVFRRKYYFMFDICTFMSQ